MPITPVSAQVPPDLNAVRTYLLDLQDRICAGLQKEENGIARFTTDEWTRPEGGGGRTRILSGGATFEKVGVAFSHVTGQQLPPSATAHRPALVGQPWVALGVSLVAHPRNPHVPTTHLNVRFFCTTPKNGGKPVWWFGGGFDLTPFYGYREDCIHWHRSAEAALKPFGPATYPRYKKWCDQYFFLKHRNEARGIGGIFFDDLAAGGFERCFSLQRAVGDAFLKAYLPIVARRKKSATTAPQRDWQLYRRGRYAEFNLVWDRGTLFGLQSGGRTESILLSLPPLVRWDYNRQALPGSAEASLVQDFLPPRDWAKGAIGIRPKNLVKTVLKSPVVNLSAKTTAKPTGKTGGKASGKK